jgi:hypothetical protein
MTDQLRQPIDAFRENCAAAERAFNASLSAGAMPLSVAAGGQQMSPSRCCRAPARVSSSDEGTCYYVCEKCNQACDLITMTNEQQPDPALEAAKEIFHWPDNRMDMLPTSADMAAIIRRHFPAPETMELVREALEVVGAQAYHCIPVHAYGDNEAASEMSRRLATIAEQVDHAIRALENLEEGPKP